MAKTIASCFNLVEAYPGIYSRSGVNAIIQVVIDIKKIPEILKMLKQFNMGPKDIVLDFYKSDVLLDKKT